MEEKVTEVVSKDVGLYLALVLPIVKLPKYFSKNLDMIDTIREGWMDISSAANMESN